MLLADTFEKRRVRPVYEVHKNATNKAIAIEAYIF